MSPSPAKLANLGIDAPPRGFTVARVMMPAGVTENPGARFHLISLHAGPPVRASCVRGGLSYQSLQTRGDIEIIPAGEAGRWVDEAPAEVLWMRIDPGFLAKVAAGIDVDPDTIDVLPRVQARDAQLEHLGWSLEAAFAEGKKLEPLFVQGLGVAVATRIIKNHAVTRPARVRRALTRKQTAIVCDYIEANLSGDLSLAKLARMAGVSASHFKALFRAALGVPTHRYVVRRRVARAAALIKAGGMPLTQVALETGFAHQSHLARAMRNVMGRTPGALAREYR